MRSHMISFVCISILCIGVQLVSSQDHTKAYIDDDYEGVANMTIDNEDEDVANMTIDDIIVASANSTQAFEFFHDDTQEVTIEYDMVYNIKDFTAMSAGDDDSDNKNSREKRAAGIKNRRWTNNRIPYQYAGGTFSSRDKAVIQSAMDDWSRYTCLTFSPATSGNRVHYRTSGGCHSMVGMYRGAQTIGLAPGCRHKGTVIHEIGHAIGLQHEQTRPDRDNYVTIMRRNIPGRLYYNFQKHSWATILNLGIPYDYKSIMHYGGRAFGNGRTTIVTKDKRYQNVIGRAQGLSFRDIKTVSLMYKCAQRCPLTDSDCPGEGFVGKDCKCWCPGSPYVTCEPTTGGGKGKTKTTEKPTVTERPDPVTSRPTTTTTTSNCYDRNTQCGQWARNNECTKNPGYMLVYCKKSCKACGDEKTGNSCVDSNSRCSSWSSYCKARSFQTYMKTNCPKTCGFCSATKKTCRDTRQDCRSLATMRRWCSYDHYKKLCPKSCNNCPASSNENDCLDSNQHCSYWAKYGQCSINTYVNQNCKKSCGTCVAQSEGPLTCTDASQHCSYWATITGECSKNAYVKTNCKKSCGTCYVQSG